MQIIQGSGERLMPIGHTHRLSAKFLGPCRSPKSPQVRMPLATSYLMFFPSQHDLMIYTSAINLEEA